MSKNNNNKLSVIIIAGNEESNIAACIESVLWADEVIVVDSESTDKTVEIAKSYPVKIVVKAWEGYAKQKAYALSLAKNEWVLSLDADERVSDELKLEIEALLKLDTIELASYYIPRKSFYWDKWIKSCGWYPGYQLRLFKKSLTTVTDRKVHEGFETPGKSGYLSGDILHYTHTDLFKTIAKVNEYSSLSVEEKYKSKKVSGLDIVLHPIGAFFSHYIVKRGFTDGVEGLMVSVMHALTNLMMYMKIWEKQNKKGL